MSPSEIRATVTCAAEARLHKSSEGSTDAEFAGGYGRRDACKPSKDSVKIVYGREGGRQ